jgi:hypothetical protein
MNILETFNPLLNSALERFQRFKDPEPRDLQKIFGPALSTICNVAGVDSARAASLIESWDPSSVTMDTLHSAVRELTAPTMADMTGARARQAALEAEIAADMAAHPPTAHDRVLLDRKKPLSGRSRDSILRELFEIRTGCIRLDVADEDGRWSSREKLPGIVCERLSADDRERILQGELDARDSSEHGVEYVPPVKMDHTLDMVRPMRG